MTKSNNFDIQQYRQHLDAKASVFNTKYNLPNIEGSPKQVTWAQDVRTKFLEQVERQEKDISPEIMSGIYTHILNQTSAKWWIDKKNVSLKDQIIYVQTLTNIENNQTKLPEPNSPPSMPRDNAILIDCQNKDKITIKNGKKDAEYIFREYHFVAKDDGTWERECSIENNERNGIIDGLCLTLLRGEFTTKVLPYKPPESPHDGKIFVKNGKLCVEARTEAVYKAASRLGCRYIYLDLANKNDILSFIQNYDVAVTNDAKQVLQND